MKNKLHNNYFRNDLLENFKNLKDYCHALYLKKISGHKLSQWDWEHLEYLVQQSEAVIKKKKNMKKSVKEEVQKIIKQEHLNCSIEEFKDKADWINISKSQPLSEDFIREFEYEVNWNLISKCQLLSEDFIKEFKNEVNWTNISYYQPLSGDFIKEFKDKINWRGISIYQTLSEDFIREFKDKVNWLYISRCQLLSEDFIREFKDKVNWLYISTYQSLSEDFIREFKDKVDWGYISDYQPLSENFIKEFKDKIDIEIQRKHHKKKSLKQKQKEAKKYAEKYNLKIDKNYLYAYRNHDKNGCGAWNKAKRYKKGIYYKDWHCDMNKNNLNSFGFGIWPSGNTKVKVKISDWGLSVEENNGKARVWGFEIIERI